MSDKYMPLFHTHRKTDVFYKTESISKIQRRQKKNFKNHNTIIKVLFHFKFSIEKTQSNF